MKNKAISLVTIFKRLFQALTLMSVTVALSGCQSLELGILHPKGVIAFEERQLLFDAVALMLIVVIPVIIMSFAFVFRYRASHKTSEYKPNWAHNNFLEAIWWGIPCAIIVILGIMTWRTSHSLDPYKKIDVPGDPMIVQVVALPWKWLFIYPDHNIATVNYLEIPKGQQVEFWLTNDNVPMSSFFIPQLGSQIYTMAGMRTRLHLLGTVNGTYQGLNSQFNGDGFSDMHFSVKVVDPEEFNSWVTGIQSSPAKLDTDQLALLEEPSIADAPKYYSQPDPKLFSQIIDSYSEADDTRGFHTEVEE